MNDDLGVRGLGARRLLAPSLRGRAEAILRGCGHALRWWIGGQLIGMALVGGLSWVGLTLIGMPLAGVLAAITALLNFIPIIGPVLAAVPVLLLALGQHSSLVLPVVALYVAIQVLEGNIITPLIPASGSSDLPRRPPMPAAARGAAPQPRPIVPAV